MKRPDKKEYSIFISGTFDNCLFTVTPFLLSFPPEQFIFKRKRQITKLIPNDEMPDIDDNPCELSKLT